jgi:hypothetical protein
VKLVWVIFGEGMMEQGEGYIDVEVFLIDIRMYHVLQYYYLIDVVLFNMLL